MHNGLNVQIMGNKIITWKILIMKEEMNNGTYLLWMEE